MALRDCLDEVRAAGGGALSDDQVLEMLEEFDATARATAERSPGADVGAALAAHADRLGRQAREAALIEKRNKAINTAVSDRLRTWLDRPEFAENPHRALVALDVGTLGLKRDARLSVAAKTTGLSRRWLGSLVASLDREGLTKLVAGGSLDREIARELWELGRVEGKGRPGITGSKEALQAARIIHALQERVIARQNRAGAWIRRMPGYVVRQSHDAGKIRRAGFQRWFDVVRDRVDEVRTFGRDLARDEREAAYRKVYDQLAAGRHLEAMGEGDLLAEAPFTGGANIAKRVSQSRALHFKNADGFMDYNDRFGTGGIMRQVVGAAQNAARNVSLMETFGTNPRMMHDAFTRLVDERLVANGMRGTDARRGLRPEAMYGVISGEANRTADRALGTLGVVARATQSWAKLGSAVLSALGDTPTMAHELSRHGTMLLAGYGKGLTNLIEHVAGSAEKRRLASMLGAYAEGVTGDLVGRWDVGDGTPGAVEEMTRLFFKLTGLTLWTDAHRAGVVRAFSAGMAERLGTAHASLPEHYRTMLEAYGIGPEEWQRLAGAVEEVGGRQYVVPQRLRLEAFGDVSEAGGRRSARQARDELATKLETFFSDRMDTAVLQPGAREKVLLLRGTRPGTPEGEFLRAIGQFKSFPTVFLSRIWGERLAQSDYLGLASVILACTVMGHLQVLAHDASKGIAPQDYSDPSQWASIFGRAFVSGGGAGILGDFMLGEFSRYGHSFVSTMAGPLFGQLDDAMDLKTRLMSLAYSGYQEATGKGFGPTGKQETDAGAAAFRMLWNNLPFNNLWFARTALLYLIAWPIQEALNPGYLRRMEQNLQKNTGQHFWMPPSQVVR